MQNGVQVPILYDSFLLLKHQRHYGTYKREFFGIVEFCRKHNHYFYSRETYTTYTDHMPLTRFLDSPTVMQGGPVN